MMLHFFNKLLTAWDNLINYLIFQFFKDNKLRRKNMALINSGNPVLSTFENHSLVWPGNCIERVLYN